MTTLAHVEALLRVDHYRRRPMEQTRDIEDPTTERTTSTPQADGHDGTETPAEQQTPDAGTSAGDE